MITKYAIPISDSSTGVSGTPWYAAPFYQYLDENTNINSHDGDGSYTGITGIGNYLWAKMNKTAINLPSTAASISVKLQMAAESVGLGTKAVDFGVDIAGTPYIEQVYPQNGSYQVLTKDWGTTNPAGGNWTAAVVNALLLYYKQYGGAAKKDAASHVSALVLTVTYDDVPGAPTGLTATKDGTTPTTKINLSWTAPVNGGESAVTGYKIERESPVGGGWSTLVANTGNTNVTYADTTCSPGTQYNYRVSAINTVGTGAASNAANATTDAAASSTNAAAILL